MDGAIPDCWFSEEWKDLAKYWNNSKSLSTIKYSWIILHSVAKKLEDCSKLPFFHWKSNQKRVVEKGRWRRRKTNEKNNGLYLLQMETRKEGREISITVDIENVQKKKKRLIFLMTSMRTMKEETVLPEKHKEKRRRKKKCITFNASPFREWKSKKRKDD